MQALLPAERNGQQVMVGDEPELSRVSVLEPPIVHDWAAPIWLPELPNMSPPMIRAESRVVVRLAVMLILNVAVLPAPAATVPSVQLVVPLQLPLVSTDHDPPAARATRLAPSNKATVTNNRQIRIGRMILYTTGCFVIIPNG